MVDSIRRLSRADAAAAAERIALAFAATEGLEGRLLGVEPDTFSREFRGKTPVHWVAVFESVVNGAVFDGPLVIRIDLDADCASHDDV